MAKSKHTHGKSAGADAQITPSESSKKAAENTTSICIAKLYALRKVCGSITLTERDLITANAIFGIAANRIIETFTGANCGDTNFPLDKP